MIENLLDCLYFSQSHIYLIKKYIFYTNPYLFNHITKLLYFFSLVMHYLHLRFVSLNVDIV